MGIRAQESAISASLRNPRDPVAGVGKAGQAGASEDRIAVAPTVEAGSLKLRVVGADGRAVEAPLVLAARSEAPGRAAPISLIAEDSGLWPLPRADRKEGWKVVVVVPGHEILVIEDVEKLAATSAPDGVLELQPTPTAQRVLVHSQYQPLAGALALAEVRWAGEACGELALRADHDGLIFPPTRPRSAVSEASQLQLSWSFFMEGHDPVQRKSLEELVRLGPELREVGLARLDGKDDGLHAVRLTLDATSLGSGEQAAEAPRRNPSEAEEAVIRVQVGGARVVPSRYRVLEVPYGERIEFELRGEFLRSITLVPLSRGVALYDDRVAAEKPRRRLQSPYGPQFRVRDGRAEVEILPFSRELKVLSTGHAVGDKLILRWSNSLPGTSAQERLSDRRELQVAGNVAETVTGLPPGELRIQAWVENERTGEERLVDFARTAALARSAGYAVAKPGQRGARTWEDGEPAEQELLRSTLWSLPAVGVANPTQTILLAWRSAPEVEFVIEGPPSHVAAALEVKARKFSPQFMTAEPMPYDLEVTHLAGRRYSARLWAGPYELRVAGAPGFACHRQRFTVPDKPHHRVAVALPRAQTMALRFLDPDGIGVPGIRVEARTPRNPARPAATDPLESTVTNPSGEARFDALLPGRYELHLSDVPEALMLPGYLPFALALDRVAVDLDPGSKSPPVRFSRAQVFRFRLLGDTGEVPSH